MDDAAYELASAVAAIALGLVLFVAIAKSEWFARIGKICFLSCWGLMVTALPIYGAVIALPSEHALASLIGCAAMLAIGGGSFFYIGFPELNRTLRHV